MVSVQIKVEVNGTRLELLDDNEERVQTGQGGYDVFLDDRLVLSSYESNAVAFSRCRRVFEEELASLLDAVRNHIAAADWKKQMDGLKARAAEAAAEAGQKGQAPPPEEEFP